MDSEFVFVNKSHQLTYFLFICYIFVIQRYKQAAVKSSTGLAAMKKLLTLVKDVQLQYRLASELGLTDMVTALLKGDTGSFLLDVSVVL